MSIPTVYNKYKKLEPKEKSEYIKEVADYIKNEIMNLMPIDGEQIFTFNKVVSNE